MVKKSIFKTFIISRNQGNANQDNLEISFYPSQNGKDEQNRGQQIVEKIWGGNGTITHSVGGLTNWYNYNGNQCGGFLKI